MRKRDFLKGLALVIGGGAAARLASTGNAIPVALAYTPRADSHKMDGQLFTRQELLTLRDFCQQLIPATDTPGAGDLDVHGFLDNQLIHCHSAEEQREAKSLIAKLNEGASEKYANPFSELSATQQLELLEAIEGGQPPFTHSDTGPLKQMKAWVAFGYYTTQIGASKELEFVPYPGGFKGSIPWNSDNRARWR